MYMYVYHTHTCFSPLRKGSGLLSVVGDEGDGGLLYQKVGSASTNPTAAGMVYIHV